MPFVETGVCRFKHWARDSCKWLSGFYLLPWPMGFISSEQRHYHGWSTSMRWVTSTACQWKHPGVSPSANVSQVSHTTKNCLRVAIVWFLASALLPWKDPSNFSSEQHPLESPPSATCLKSPSSWELSSGLNFLNWCRWNGGGVVVVIFWQQSSLARYTPKWSQAS